MTLHAKSSNQARLDNRRGCFVDHIFRNSKPQFRFDTHPRPAGRHSLNVRLCMSAGANSGARPFPVRQLKWMVGLLG
jgi:hypothetical protein